MVENVSTRVLDYIIKVKNDTLWALKLLIIHLKIVLQYEKKMDWDICPLPISYKRINFKIPYICISIEESGGEGGGRGDWNGEYI